MDLGKFRFQTCPGLLHCSAPVDSHCTHTPSPQHEPLEVERDGVTPARLMAILMLCGMLCASCCHRPAGSTSDLRSLVTAVCPPHARARPWRAVGLGGSISFSAKESVSQVVLKLRGLYQGLKMVLLAPDLRLHLKMLSRAP